MRRFCSGTMTAVFSAGMNLKRSNSVSAAANSVVMLCSVGTLLLGSGPPVNASRRRSIAEISADPESESAQPIEGVRHQTEHGHSKVGGMNFFGQLLARTRRIPPYVAARPACNLPCLSDADRT